MTEKIDYYDVLATVIPGVLMLCWVQITFPIAGKAVSNAGLPDAVMLIALISFSFLVGQVILALSSILEPCLFWTWGGRPSDRALEEGLGERYFPESTAKRIRGKLACRVGANDNLRSLFLYALQLAARSGATRMTRFNSLYVFHRVHVIFASLAIIMTVVSKWYGAAAKWPCHQLTFCLTALVVMLVVLWARARQRAYYHVREVLLSAERALDSETSSTK